MKLLLLLGVLAYASSQCVPETFYMLRHTERFQAFVGNGRDDAQEVMTGEGWERARALRDKFNDEQLPLDAIFVTVDRYIRSYITAAPLDADRGVPIVRYNFDANNLAAIVAAQNPCPQHVLVVNHGAWINNVFNAVGYTGPPILNQAAFGEFFTFRPATPTVMERGRFGVAASQGNQRWPFGPNGQQCLPHTFYIFRHAERFTASNGNGNNDAEEILTPEGFSRARDLREKFLTEQLPLDGIFATVDRFIRSYQTAAALEAALAVPVTRYPPGNDAELVRLTRATDPCLENVAVVTHGAYIRQVMAALGYTGPEPPQVTAFGQFYTLRLDPATGANSLEIGRYGPDASAGNQPWPGVLAPSFNSTKFTV